VACGIAHVLPSGEDLPARVAELTAGRMCGTVVDATGISSVITDTAPSLCGKQAEIVLLGSPRAPHTADITPFLSQLHLCRPAATIKGALEWRYPLRDDGEGFAKHSIERNVRQLLDLLAQRRLRVAPLITHRASPADCQAVYDGLTHRKDIYTGVVFDWSKL
jgi:threonine dehydrogenase-like Zn-dependent dehydrogenase